MGYTGQNCEIVCPFPSYGLDCQSVCNCTETTCDHVNGCRGYSSGTYIVIIQCLNMQYFQFYQSYAKVVELLSNTNNWRRMHKKYYLVRTYLRTRKITCYVISISVPLSQIALYAPLRKLITYICWEFYLQSSQCFLLEQIKSSTGKCWLNAFQSHCKFTDQFQTYSNVPVRFFSYFSI